MKSLKMLFFGSMLLTGSLGIVLLSTSEVEAAGGSREEQKVPCWCNNNPTPCSGNDVNCVPGESTCQVVDCSGGNQY